MTGRIFILILLLIPSVDSRGVRARRAITLTHPVCQDIWNAATSNLIVGTDMTVNQHSIPSLFTFQPSGNAKLTHPAFGNFTALLQAYLPGTTLSAAVKTQRETDFLDAIVVTGGPVDVAYQYLKANGKTTQPTLQDFKLDLDAKWFQQYSKPGFVGLFSGFEHTFVGELRGATLKGFHNWYHFHLEKTAAPPRLTNVVVNSYAANNPPLLNVAFDWHGAHKNQASFFVGTSPAFDMALFSVCFFGMLGPGAPSINTCTCQINGAAVTIQACAQGTQIKTTYPK